MNLPKIVRLATVFIAANTRQTANQSHMNVLRIINELEQLVEESKGILGKRLVPEEEFFAKVQQLRSALPKTLKDAEQSEFTVKWGAPANELTSNDKLHLIARWSAELARDES